MKNRLLRARLHEVLAELTGELHHYYEAAMIRPEAQAHAALGLHSAGLDNRIWRSDIFDTPWSTIFLTQSPSIDAGVR